MKDGLYWVKFRDSDDKTIVRIIGDDVLSFGTDDDYDLAVFKGLAEFISKEPLTPPETP